jgi:hypothetical protein
MTCTNGDTFALHQCWHLMNELSTGVLSSGFSWLRDIMCNNLQRPAPNDTCAIGIRCHSSGICVLWQCTLAEHSECAHCGSAHAALVLGKMLPSCLRW